ncbi:winged helix-turn-helix domain-containing protein [Microbacterium sp. ABRD28]|uniref:ArsR/SmtB family transcription factor n=1 Tax=Microbacterium sp. ABRD28 TaxID=2268461 RepID=UPI000F5529D1|nr:winged helix-turn-helix domain-containing protein [Microbacterium sp. ABRD28]AZC14949.1 ArsR family transcriptional regulator [Microbacterium sp. ABRD28]
MDATALDDLRQEVAALAARLTALEAEAAPAAPGAPAAPAPAPGDAQAPGPGPGLDPETFWALHGLQARLADHPSTTDGAVMLVGSVRLPGGGGDVVWQQGFGAEGLLAAEWSAHAATLAALGHPVRLELLRQILAGRHTTADLATLDDLGTTGQLHHHLRQLVATGWVRQSGRGSYEVPATRVVPLLAVIAGAER